MYQAIYVFDSGPEKIKTCRHCPRVVKGHWTVRESSKSIELYMARLHDVNNSEQMCPLGYMLETPKEIVLHIESSGDID